MLYYLHLLSGEGSSVFSVFQGVAFRAAFAALFAFLACVTLGPHLIASLRRRKIHEDVTKSDSSFLTRQHSGKRHTPTMGGVLLIGVTLLVSVCFARPDVLYVPLALFVMAALGLLGFYDDWIKLTRRHAKGLSIKQKLAAQFLIGAGAGTILFLYGAPEGSPEAGALAVPFLDAALWPALGYGYIGWAALVLAGSSNAVNLTDGLDGLAAVCTLSVALALGVMAYFAGHAGWAAHFQSPRVPGAAELAVVCGALAGSCLGFLWFNAHPAEVFMGDTGSLALGGLIGLIALSIRQELMLVLAGGVFVAEALSVLIQIASFRCFGRRVFLIAPLHHHLEMLGWPETKIVSRFFIVSVLLAVFSVAALRMP